MKKEWTEQDLRAFAENAQTAFEDVTLTEADEETADTWQDDGLQVDYVLRNGQVDCVLRRLIEADGKLWQLQMTAPLAGSDLPEDRMTARERRRNDRAVSSSNFFRCKQPEAAHPCT